MHALSQGALPHQLLQHARECTVCGEVRLVSQQLEHLLEGAVEEPMESAASMWWRLNVRLHRQQMNRAQLPLVWMWRVCFSTLLLTAFFVLWELSAHITVSDVLTVGILALAAVGLPVMIVLWRWSRS